MDRSVSPDTPRRVVLRLALLLLLLGISPPPRLAAQVIDTNQFINHFPLPDVAAPIRPIWGFNDDEYSVGAYIQTDSDTLPHVWPLARGLGVKIIENRTPMVEHPFDNLIRDAIGRDTVTGEWKERVIYMDVPPAWAGWGREVILYPFDSAQSYYWPCIFKNWSGGGKHYNADPGSRDHWKRASSEMWYDTPNTTPNQEICSRIIFGNAPSQRNRRYSLRSGDGDSVEISGDAFWERQDLDLTNRINNGVWNRSRNLFFVVTGHLFDTAAGGQTANMSDSLLKLEIWAEIPKGKKWHGSDAALHTAIADTEFLYDTRYLTKAQIAPLLPANNFDAYREIPFMVDMARNPLTGNYGPWDPGAPFDDLYRRFDLRVRWIGKEKIAVRSIAIRDSIAQLLFGSGAEADTFRASIHRMADRVMWGSDTTRDSTVLKRRMGTLIRFGAGDEATPLRYAGFSWIDSTLYRRFRSKRAGDSLTFGTRAWHGMNDTSWHSRANTSQNELNVETYIVARLDGYIDTSLGLPPHLLNIPLLPEHNGGRFGLSPLTIGPSISTSRDSVEMYTRAFQRRQFGEYVSGPRAWPRSETMFTLLLGNTAAMSRRTGRRMIHWPGDHVPFALAWRRDDAAGIVEDSASRKYVLDTIVNRLPEASEMRAMVNLGLCYGARGIHWPFIGGNNPRLRDTAFMDKAGHAHYNWSTDWGDIGAAISDSTDYKRTDSAIVFYNQDASTTDTIRNFYTGWGTRLRAIRWLNRTWLGSIGPEMLKLRWRDGYSMHFTVPASYISDTGQANVRSFPTTEIVRSIETWDRWGHKDSANATYVELGLFDKHIGTTNDKYDPRKDTNYVFVVNRRTFERPEGVSDTSARGRLMDSLAETRILRISLRATNPDTSQYNPFIRVTEVRPDTSRLPGTSVPRAGLDTVVRNDSTIALRMRPGGGALLRITYAPPDESIVDGDLRFNNQRKMIYTGGRYFATYSRNDTVFLRRSIPVGSATGGILWEPIEWDISSPLDSLHDTLRLESRYPSLTARYGTNDTVISVVWSCHPANVPYTGFAGREIVIRDIGYHWSYGGGIGLQLFLFSPLKHVDYYNGLRDTIWGTPVICSEGNGEIIAWSDSVGGVIARARRLDTRLEWFRTLDILSAPGSISSASDTGSSRYPTMPTFAHIGRGDSSSGIAWQHPVPASPFSAIYYTRLTHARTSLGVDTLVPLLSGSSLPITGSNTANLHPSIDLQQDALGRIQEAVTWEVNSTMTYLNPLKPFNPYTIFGRDICVQSIGLNEATTPPTPLFQGPIACWMLRDTFQFLDTLDAYPNISAINRVITLADTADSAMFGVVFQHMPYPPTPSMRHATIRFGGGTFEAGWPRVYAWGGEHPAGTASQIRQDLRYAALYEQGTDSTNLLRTSRQFYARTRPTGYIATGRRARFRISDSLRTDISLMLHDVWYSGSSGGGSARMAPRANALERTDSLPQVRNLLRSGYFHAWDSTMIGCEIVGRYLGDSAAGASACIDAIAELVDSATGSVVAQLDSFSVSAISRHHAVQVAPTLDLTSGTYFVRLRMESASFPSDSVWYDSRYPVAELASEVATDRGLGKRRIGDEESGARLRLSVSPNPLSRSTSIQFTLPTAGQVTLRLLNVLGAEVVRLMDDEWTEPGRYAVPAGVAGSLAPGTYLIDLRTAREHAMAKLVVSH